MDRRELLRGAGPLVAAASLGGCLSRYGLPTDAGGGGTTLADQSLELTDAGCGEGANDAGVSFDAAADEVVVTGTIPGPDACYTAEIADARYDPDAGTLDVTVASVRREGAQGCAECITDIGYEAAFAFEGGLPESVTVVHDAMGERATVATAQSS